MRCAPSLAAVMMLLAIALAARAHALDLVVIVHPTRHEMLGRAEIAQIYLRKRRFWSDGARIVPVNLGSGSEGRALFVRKIFGDDARRLAGYWNRQYFQGVLPPLSLASALHLGEQLAGAAFGPHRPGLVMALWSLMRSAGVCRRIGRRRSSAARCSRSARARARVTT